MTGSDFNPEKVPKNEETLETKATLPIQKIKNSFQCAKLFY